MKIKAWACALLFALSFSTTAQNSVQSHGKWVTFEYSSHYIASTTGNKNGNLLKACSTPSSCKILIGAERPCIDNDIENIIVMSDTENLIVRAVCQEGGDEPGRYTYTVLNNSELSKILKGGHIFIAFNGMHRELFSLEGAEVAMQSIKNMAAHNIKTPSPPPASPQAYRDLNQSSLYTHPPPASSQSLPSYGDTGSNYTPSSGGPVYVRGYYRKDGTYVQPHTRSRPKR